MKTKQIFICDFCGAEYSTFGAAEKCEKKHNIKEEKEEKEEVPVMLSISEAANATNQSYSYIRRLCCEGKIPTIKNGKKYLISKKNLIKYFGGEEA